jgi:hypothetical protein
MARNENDAPMKLKVINIADSPVAFYFQRQSRTMNGFLKEPCWRFYYDSSQLPGCEHFLDLSEHSSREEVMEALESAEVHFFHGTRNYRRPLNCRDGVIGAADYPSGKPECVLIHGEPEVLDPNNTNRFIQQHKQAVAFFVATPNQLQLFRDVRLYPIVGLFEVDDPAYTPRENYAEPGDSIRLLRRSEWKGGRIAAFVCKELGLKRPPPTLRLRLRLAGLAQGLLGKRSRNCLHLLAEELSAVRDGKSMVFDNRCHFQEIFQVLSDLKNADILLENDDADYPGGGTSHTIGLEAMALGVAIFNAMSKANAEAYTAWLGADRLPPYPNWDGANAYRRQHRQYLRRLMYDDDFRLSRKRESRRFFEEWLNVRHVAPKLLGELQQAL